MSGIRALHDVLLLMVVERQLCGMEDVGRVTSQFSLLSVEGLVILCYSASHLS